MQNRGTTKAHSAPILLIGSIIFAVLSIVPHVVRPTDSTVYYVGLTVALIVAGIVALLLIARDEKIAVQIFWWSVLAVIGGMVAIDDRSGNLPAILYIPPIAAVAVRVLVSVRAAVAYCGGVAALMIPAGVAYDDLGWAMMIVGSVALYIAVDWIKTRGRGVDADVLLPVLYAREASAQKALDEIST